MSKSIPKKTSVKEWAKKNAKQKPLKIQEKDVIELSSDEEPETPIYPEYSLTDLYCEEDIDDKSYEGPNQIEYILNRCDELEEENEKLRIAVTRIEFKLSEYDTIRKNQIKIIEDLEKKLLDSDSNLESSFVRKINK